MSAQPAIAAEREFSLSALVRAALESDEPDPHRIAENVIASMSLADARMALAETLPNYVREIIRSQRRGRAATAPPASQRWGNVAELHASGELTLLRVRVFALGQWKFLGDCTRDDVQAIADDRDAEAAANTAAADRFKRLRTAMGRKRAAVVSELPAAVLSEIFDA